MTQLTQNQINSQLNTARFFKSQVDSERSGGTPFWNAVIGSLESQAEEAKKPEPKTPERTPQRHHTPAAHHSGGGGYGELEALFAMFERTLSAITKSLQATPETDRVDRSGLEDTIKTRRVVGDETVLKGLLTNNRPSPTTTASIDEVVDVATGKRYNSEAAAKKAGVANYVKAYLYDAEDI